MRINKKAMMDLIQGWERQLTELHPRDSSVGERERVDLATLLFNHEARTAVTQLIQEVKAGYAAEEKLTYDLREAKRKLAHANHQIAQLREKNKRLKA